MVKGSSLTAKEIPDFIHHFLSSKYVASFLGFYIPNLYDIREFLLDSLEEIEFGFIRLSFSNFDEKLFLEGFEDRVILDDLKQFLNYLLKHFFQIRDYFQKKNERFHIEIHFQIPFIHKSILKSADKKRLLLQKKARYYNTFRQNLRGMFIIVSAEDEVSAVVPDGFIVKEFSLSEENLRLVLAYPSKLKDYWTFVLDNSL
ncbi:MAG: hypothetical protein OHK0040_04240 [bacterium]